MVALFAKTDIYKLLLYGTLRNKTHSQIMNPTLQHNTIFFSL